MNDVKKLISGIAYFFFSSVFSTLILKELGMLKLEKIPIFGFDYELTFKSNIGWRVEALILLTILAISTIIFIFLNDQSFRCKKPISLKEIGFYHNAKTKPVVLVFFLCVILISTIFYDFNVNKPKAIAENFTLFSMLFIFYTSIVISLFLTLIMRPFKYLLSVTNKKILAYLIYDILIVATQAISFAVCNMRIDLFEIISAALWGFIYMYTYDTSDYSIYPLWILISVRYVVAFLP